MIFTIGHSTHGVGELVGLLRAAKIDLLADVRRFPHLEGLGGRRQPLPGSANAGWRVGQFRGYADHMASEEFRKDLAWLVEAARERRVAVMCAEAQWRRCHRRLLADALVVEGLEVVHLGARGQREAHEQTPFAVVEDGRLRYPEQQARLEL